MTSKSLRVEPPLLLLNCPSSSSRSAPARAAEDGEHEIARWCTDLATDIRWRVDTLVALTVKRRRPWSALLGSAEQPWCPEIY